MKHIIHIFLLGFLMYGCKSKQGVHLQDSPDSNTHRPDFSIAFGSCNKPGMENVFWDDILQARPDVFIWGGDNVYADTDDVSEIEDFYKAQHQVPGYAALKEKVIITGTWDDHDYGANDAGVEFPSKKGSQNAFLNFLEVPKDDARRLREGVYSSQVLTKPGGTLKIINLDTRYFRTAITPDKREGRRYRPNTYGDGTLLGEKQWKWLENELNISKADFNLIVSSIQFLSDLHGWEKWANHPHEVDRLKKVIVASGAKGVIILSGDRHISEFSRATVPGLPYPLIDFTASGLTHAYTGFSGEENPYRIGEVVAQNNYGHITLDTDTKTVRFRIMGDGGKVLQELKQAY